MFYRRENIKRLIDLYQMTRKRKPVFLFELVQRELHVLQLSVHLLQEHLQLYLLGLQIRSTIQLISFVELRCSCNKNYFKDLDTDNRESQPSQMLSWCFIFVYHLPENALFTISDRNYTMRLNLNSQ